MQSVIIGAVYAAWDKRDYIAITDPASKETGQKTINELVLTLKWNDVKTTFIPDEDGFYLYLPMGEEDFYFAEEELIKQIQLNVPTGWKYKIDGKRGENMYGWFITPSEAVDVAKEEMILVNLSNIVSYKKKISMSCLKIKVVNADKEDEGYLPVFLKKGPAKIHKFSFKKQPEENGGPEDVLDALDTIVLKWDTSGGDGVYNLYPITTDSKVNQVSKKGTYQFRLLRNTKFLLQAESNEYGEVSRVIDVKLSAPPAAIDLELNIDDSVREHFVNGDVSYSAEVSRAGRYFIDNGVGRVTGFGPFDNTLINDDIHGSVIGPHNFVHLYHMNQKKSQLGSTLAYDAKPELILDFKAQLISIEPLENRGYRYKFNINWIFRSGVFNQFEIFDMRQDTLIYSSDTFIEKSFFEYDLKVIHKLSGSYPFKIVCLDDSGDSLDYKYTQCIIAKDI